jgi:hypothetical protein
MRVRCDYDGEPSMCCSVASGNVYKFTGKERNGETSNDNFGARYGVSALAGLAGPQLAQLAAKAPAALWA